MSGTAERAGGPAVYQDRMELMRWVLTQPDMTPHAKLVLSLLAAHAGSDLSCSPRIARMAEVLNLSIRAVRLALAELDEANMLDRFDRPGTTTIYVLTPGRVAEATPAQNDRGNVEPLSIHADPLRKTPSASSLSPLVVPTIPPAAASTELRVVAGRDVTEARRTLFHDGLFIVRQMTGLPVNRVRSVLGKILKQLGDDASQANVLIQDCIDLNPAVPIEWLMAAAAARAPAKKSYSTIERDWNLPSIHTEEEQRMIDAAFA